MVPLVASRPPALSRAKTGSLGVLPRRSILNALHAPPEVADIESPPPVGVSADRETLSLLRGKSRKIPLARQAAAAAAAAAAASSASGMGGGASGERDSIAVKLTAATAAAFYKDMTSPRALPVSSAGSVASILSPASSFSSSSSWLAGIGTNTAAAAAAAVTGRVLRSVPKLRNAKLRGHLLSELKSRSSANLSKQEHERQLEQERRDREQAECDDEQDAAASLALAMIAASSSAANSDNPFSFRRVDTNAFGLAADASTRADGADDVGGGDGVDANDPLQLARASLLAAASLGSGSGSAVDAHSHSLSPTHAHAHRGKLHHMPTVGTASSSSSSSTMAHSHSTATVSAPTHRSALVEVTKAVEHVAAVRQQIAATGAVFGYHRVQILSQSQISQSSSESS